MKKLISLLLAVSLFTSMSVNAFAADRSDIPEIEKTTITYEMPAPTDDENAGIQPLIWNQESHETSKQIAYTPLFVIPDRYFAYEMSATSGNPSGSYAITLIDHNEDLIVRISNTANSSTKKADWITVDAGQTYQFKVSNLTGSNLKFSITYYSWK